MLEIGNGRLMQEGMVNTMLETKLVLILQVMSILQVILVEQQNLVTHSYPVVVMMIFSLPS